jgi:3-oxoacyl-[acyl-carrier protein] reductase
VGRAIALRLAADGFAVIVNYRTDGAAAERTRSEAEALGVPASVFQADASSQDDVRKLFAHVRTIYGRLDVLVNSVGMLHEGLFAMTSPSKFMAVLSANLGATVLCTHAALPMMIAKRRGSIVNVSSATATYAPHGLSAYASAKAAINTLTRGVAREVASFGIRVNAVAPTWVDTELIAGLEANAQVAERMKRIPLGRVARAEEVAAVVSALVREDMTYVLGQTITIDGGGSL